MKDKINRLNNLFDRLITLGVLKTEDKQYIVYILTPHIFTKPIFNLLFSVTPIEKQAVTPETKEEIRTISAELLESLKPDSITWIKDQYKKRNYLQICGSIYIRACLIIGDDYFFEREEFQIYLENITAETVNFFINDPLVSTLAYYFKYLLEKNDYHKISDYLKNEDISSFLLILLKKLINYNDPKIILSLLEQNIITIDQTFEQSKQKRRLLEMAFEEHALDVAKLLIEMNEDSLWHSSQEIINRLADCDAGTKKQDTLEFLFKYIPDIKTLLQLLKIDTNSLDTDILTTFNYDEIKKCYFNPQVFIEDILNTQNQTKKLAAYLLLLKKVYSTEELLLTSLVQKELDPNYIKVIVANNNIELSSDLVDELDDNEEEEEDNNRTEFEKIARSIPANALAIMQHHRLAKTNLNPTSPLDLFFEVKIGTTTSFHQKIPSVYYVTFVAIHKHHFNNVSKLLEFLKLDFMSVNSIREYHILRISADLSTLVKKINHYAEVDQLYIQFDKRAHNYNNLAAPTKITEFLRWTTPLFLAANKVKKASRLSAPLKQISHQNIIRLQKNFRSILNSIQDDKEKESLVNLFNYLCDIDYVIMHATNHEQSILTTNNILSFHRLKNVMLKDIGQTSTLDTQFGNTDYVFGIFSSKDKPFPKELEGFYGDKVFVFSYKELLKLKKSIWVKSTDWYYFASKKEVKLSFGDTTVFVTHSQDSQQLSNSSKNVSFIINNQVVHSKPSKLADESFMDKDIPLGLAFLIIEQFIHLDRKFKMDMLAHFLTTTDDNLNREQRKRVANELFKLLPACEASVANNIALEEESLLDIYSLSQPDSFSYKNLNCIHQALSKNASIEELQNLIITNQSVIDTVHPISKISLLNKAILSQRYDFIELLIALGANVNKPSRIAKHSDKFLPLFVAILMSDEKAFKLLVNNKASINQTIYPAAPKMISPRDRWDVGITPLSFSYLLPSNEFQNSLQQIPTFKLPQKTLAVFVPLAEVNDEKLILLGRKGYLHRDQLKSYGDWVFPALTLKEEDKEDLIDTLSYLIDTGFSSDLSFKELFSLENIVCGVTEYTIKIYTVHLNKEVNNVPNNSGHLCELTWVNVNDLATNNFMTFAGLKVHKSNVLILQNLKNASVDHNALIEAWRFDLSSSFLLHKAIIDNDVQTVRTLLEQGVYANAKITLLNPKNKQWIMGCTPLMTATLYAKPMHYEHLIELLAKYNADPHILDKKGNNALFYADDDFKKVYQKYFQHKDKELRMFVSKLLSKNFLQDNNNSRKRNLEADELEESTSVKHAKNQ